MNKVLNNGSLKYVSIIKIHDGCIAGSQEKNCRLFYETFQTILVKCTWSGAFWIRLQKRYPYNSLISYKKICKRKNIWLLKAEGRA